MKAEGLQSAIAEFFAPWIQALDLEVQSGHADSVVLRLPLSSRLTRSGDILCGQAMMAAADTAMALAVFRHFATFRACTTVQMNSSFLKPLSAQDALIEARVLRAGKSLVFGEIDIRGASDGKSVCRSTATFALMG